MPKLSHIEGIGPSNEAKLNEAGIKNTDKLLLKVQQKKDVQSWLKQPESVNT